MLELFRSLCVPFNQKDGNTLPDDETKKIVIDEILNGLNLNKYHDELNYLLYTSGNLEEVIKGDYFVFMTHMDLIGKFHKGFLTPEKREPYVLEDNGIIKGALDNTITNAALIKSMQEIHAEKGEIPENVLFVFTYGEEKGMWGARKFMEMLGDNVSNGSFYNMDVTNEGYRQGKSVSVEYDEPSLKSMFDIVDRFDDKFKMHYTNDRMCDDCDQILRAKGKGLSVCLPTGGNIHSWTNESTVEMIDDYQKFLKSLIEEPLKLRKPKDIELDFRDLLKIYEKEENDTSDKILEAIKAEEKKLKKEEKKRKRRMEKMRKKNGYGNYYGSNSFRSTSSGNLGHNYFNSGTTEGEGGRTLFDFNDDDDITWGEDGFQTVVDDEKERHDSLRYIDVIENLISYNDSLDQNVIYLLTDLLKESDILGHEHIPINIIVQELEGRKEPLGLSHLEKSDIEKGLNDISNELTELGLLDEAQLYSYNNFYFNENVNSFVKLEELSEEYQVYLGV